MERCVVRIEPDRGPEAGRFVVDQQSGWDSRDLVHKDRLGEHLGKVAMGYSRIAALKSNGTLWAWGTGAHGIIGIPLYAILETPTQVGTDTDWLTIATGGDSSLGIKTDGSLWGWGTNGYGKLGTGWTNPGYQPTRIGVLTGWTRIASAPSQYGHPRRWIPVVLGRE